jgi:hypothetical protein
MTESERQAIATLAASIVVARGVRTVPEIQRAWDDAAEIVRAALKPAAPSRTSEPEEIEVIGSVIGPKSVNASLRHLRR